jgi:hypothetical protein
MDQRGEPQAVKRVNDAHELFESGRFARQPLLCSLYIVIDRKGPGDPERLRRIAQTLVDLAHQSGDLFDLGYALSGLAGVATVLRGDEAASLLAEAQRIGETLRSQKLLATCAMVETNVRWYAGESQLGIAAADNARRRSYDLRLRSPSSFTASVYNYWTHTFDALSQSIYRWIIQESVGDLDHTTLLYALHHVGLSLGATGRLPQGAELFGFTRPRVSLFFDLDMATETALGSARAEFERLAQASTLESIEDAAAYALAQLDVSDHGATAC